MAAITTRMLYLNSSCGRIATIVSAMMMIGKLMTMSVRRMMTKSTHRP